MQFRQAIKQEEEAIRLTPNDPAWRENLATDRENLALFHYNLANANIAIGDRDSATAEYNTLKGLDATRAAEVLKYINPPQSTSTPAPEPAPTYNYFRVRAIKSESEVPYGHENSGYYIYNTVTNLNTGQQCVLRCWRPLSGANGCYKLREGETYAAKREYKVLRAGRVPNTCGLYIEMNVDGANVWVEFLGCGKD